MLKKLLTTCCMLLIVAISGCQKKPHSANEVIVGTIAGPETTLMEVAADVAKKKYQLDIKIISFNDYVLPNQALADGSLDANMFQHLPYLQSAIKAKGLDLVAIGKTYIYPMGIYSKTLSDLKKIKTGAIVAIPNDPSNQARALLLLQQAGVITLKDQDATNAALQTIKHNPHKLSFKEMDAAQLPRVLEDVDIAAINTNYAMIAGLLPTHDAIFIESASSPYANIIAVRTQDRDKKQLKELVAAMQSDEVQLKAKELFKGQAIPAWQR